MSPVLRPRAAAIAALFSAALSAGGASGQGVVQLAPGGHDPSTPIEVTSDRLEFDRGTGLVVFLGSVEATQSDLTMRAPEIRVNFDTGATGGGGRQVDTVEALGGVVIERGPERAEAEAATYNLARGEVVMSSGVTFTQPSGVVRGGQMTLDLATGLGQFSGRVRATLSPGN
jgi:lipopolysaccharide export system protein LptA